MCNLMKSGVHSGIYGSWQNDTWTGMENQLNLKSQHWRKTNFALKFAPDTTHFDSEFLLKQADSSEVALSFCKLDLVEYIYIQLNGIFWYSKVQSFLFFSEVHNFIALILLKPVFEFTALVELGQNKDAVLEHTDKS